MPSDAENRDFALSEALKAAAYDMRKLADKHVAELRAQGLDDLADNVERMARDAEASAQEHDTTGSTGA